MRFVRENLFYVILVAVVVVVGGAAAYYYFGSGIGKTIKNRTSASKEIRDLARPGELKVDANAVKAMKARIERLTQANKADANACLEFNSKNLPVLRISQEGSATVALATPFDRQRYETEQLYIPFISTYNRTMDMIISPQRPGLLPTTPPTQEEVAKVRDDLIDKFKDLPAMDIAQKAFQQVMLQKADGSLIYIDPSETTSGSLERTIPLSLKKAAPDDLWAAQVNCWVTDEIIRAIIGTNQTWQAELTKQAGSLQKPSVTTSAVKRLIGITVARKFGQASGQSTATLTQRETSAKYLVVPYKFSVVMPTRHINRLIGTLEAQNYHNVTDIALSQVSPNAVKQGFYYGIEPVMNVEFTCELLLLADYIADKVPASLASRFPNAKAGK